MLKGLDTKKSAAAGVLTLTDFGFSAENIAKMCGAVISATVAGAMVTWSGVDPETNVGHPVPITTPYLRLGAQRAAQLKVITASKHVTITLEY